MIKVHAWHNLAFTHKIHYKDYPIELEVIAEYYKGSTPAMGDDPDEFVILKAIDGTGSNVWSKLSKLDQDCIIEAAHEEALQL